MKRNLEAELEAARKEVKQLQELVDLKTKYRQLAEQLGMDTWPKIQQIPYIPPSPPPWPFIPWYRTCPEGSFRVVTGSTTNMITLDNGSAVTTRAIVRPTPSGAF